MLDWIIPTLVIAVLCGGIYQANRRMGKPRADGRPNQVPWGMVMVFCAMGIFISIVHLLNVCGLQTGPEHSLFGRF